MRKAAKLFWLLGVLLVISGAAFAVSRYEEKKEQIKNSGETILEIPTDSVTALSWTNEEGTWSFTKDETWTYDGDAAFPVDEAKINDLLSQFQSFGAAFTIEEVTDFGQYGLEKPTCTIDITAGETGYTVRLGDFSKMDEERYISIGDGNVYLAVHDPLEEFDAVLRDMILDDTVPEFDTAQEIRFQGQENYTVTREEDTKSLCAEDVYFTDGKPLDTDNVDSLMKQVENLSLTDYVSYNVTSEELTAFGLDNPELTIALDYTTEDGETGTVNLSLSQNSEEKAAYEKAVEQNEEDLPDVTCYARLGDSQIIYEITQSTYDKLTAVSYNTLRHQELFTGDFDTVTSIEVTLGGETSIFTYTPAEKEDEEGTWTYGETEFDVSDLKNALLDLTAAEFTEEKPTGQEEISVTLHLDNENFPTWKSVLYRYDGTNCVAAVDGKPTALVSRSQMVALTEAVNAIVLGNS